MNSFMSKSSESKRVLANILTYFFASKCTNYRNRPLIVGKAFEIVETKHKLSFH